MPSAGSTAPGGNRRGLLRRLVPLRDLGYRDEDGFVFIVDRKKELIIRGGYNVYPREIEEVLYERPAVGQAAVVGVPDERLGEEVKAYVATREATSVTEQEVVEFVKSRVAAYKYPRIVEFRDELPQGPTCKILKAKLSTVNPPPPR